MNWTEATIWTSTTALDIVTNMLMDMDVEGFVIEDAQDFADFLEDTEIYWDYVDEDLVKQKSEAETNIKIYLEDSPKGLETLSQIKSGLLSLKADDTENGYGRLEVELSTVRQEDWENNWKQFFKPFKVGEKFVIKPSWETYDEQTDRIILEIDPSSSFGTGTHNTTQLCICQLEKLIKPGDRLLDMGCGSGILSVAASLLGAADITAVDIDANSIKISLENAEKNNIGLKTFLGDVIRDKKLESDIGSGFDVIVANIVADVIMGMQETFKSKLKPDGILIVSGIIAPRADEVQDSLVNAGFDVLERHQSGDWVALQLRMQKNTIA